MYGLRLFHHHILRILVQDAMRFQDPVMVIYNLADQWGPLQALSFCATTAYHVTVIKGKTGLRGEEGRVMLVLRDGEQAVVVEIVSIGKARPFV
jgi:hypothetical protein